MRFYLIDRITSCEPGLRASARKAVSLSEDFLEQHFAGIPIMPGTMMLEGMAQLSGYLLACTMVPEAPHRHKAILTMVERAKFRQVVQPGNVILYESKIVQTHTDSAKCEVEARVEGELVASARLLFTFRALANDLLEENRRQTFAIWTTGASQALDPDPTR